MNKSVKMKLAMYESVLVTLKGKQSLLDNSPALINAVEKFESDVLTFKGVAYAHDEDIKWITARKNLLDDTMLNKAITINKVLVAYAINNGLNDIVERFKCTKTTFKKGGIQGKLARVQKLIELVSEYLPELAPYNVSQEDFEALVFSFNELDSFVRSPRIASTKRSVMTSTLKESNKTITQFLNLVVDAIMLKLDTTDHESYLQYVQARKLIHSPSKHRESGA